MELQLPQADMAANMALGNATVNMAQMEIKHSMVVGMFPDLNLIETLTNYGHMSSDALVGYIIDNMGKIPKKQKPTKRKTNSPELEESTGEEVFSELSDFEESDDDLLLDRLIMELLQNLKHEILKLPPHYYMTHRENMENFLKDEFPTVRAEYIKTMVRLLEGRIIAAAIACFLAEHRYGGKVQKFIPNLASNSSFVHQVGPINKPRQMKKNKTDYADYVFYKDFVGFEKLMDKFRAKYPALMHGRKLTKDAYILKADAQETEHNPEQKLECIVCYETFPISRMVFCAQSGPLIQDPNQPCSSKDDLGLDNNSETHCFCRSCVRGHAKAATNEMPLADGGVGLKCMAHDCNNSILYAEIRTLISSEIRKKLDERILEENLGLADIQNLERCKNCNFAMEIEVPATVDKVFKCLHCDFEFCRLCERPWDEDHFGITCEELDVKQKTDKKKRELEKKMNEAVIRKCPRCAVPFVKTEGCNKMTCRCGMTQCYLCRATQINYSHFCEHFRDPKVNSGSCDKCSKPCLLWEDATKRDERILHEIENGINSEGDDVKATPKNTEEAEANDSAQQLRPNNLVVSMADDELDRRDPRRIHHHRGAHQNIDEYNVNFGLYPNPVNQIPMHQPPRLENTFGLVMQQQPMQFPTQRDNDPYFQPFNQANFGALPRLPQIPYSQIPYQPTYYGAFTPISYNNNFYPRADQPPPIKEYEPCISCGRRYLKNSARCPYCLRKPNLQQQIRNDEAAFAVLTPLRATSPLIKHQVDPAVPGSSNANQLKEELDVGLQLYGINRKMTARKTIQPPNSSFENREFIMQIESRLNLHNNNAHKHCFVNRLNPKAANNRSTSPPVLVSRQEFDDEPTQDDPLSTADQLDKFEEICNRLREEIDRGIRDQIQRNDKQTDKPDLKDLDLLLQDLNEIDAKLDRNDLGIPEPPIKHIGAVKRRCPTGEGASSSQDKFLNNMAQPSAVHLPNPDVPGTSLATAPPLLDNNVANDKPKDASKLYLQSLQEIHKRQGLITAVILQQEQSLDRLIFSIQDNKDFDLDRLRELRNRTSQTNDESFVIASDIRRLVNEAVERQISQIKRNVDNLDELEVVGFVQRHRNKKTPDLIDLSSDDDEKMQQSRNSESSSESKNGEDGGTTQITLPCLRP